MFSTRHSNQGCCKHSFAPGRSSAFTAINFLTNSNPCPLTIFVRKTPDGNSKLPKTYRPSRRWSLKRVSPVSMRNVIAPRDHISTAFVYESSDLLPCETNRRTSGATKAGEPICVRNAVSPSIARLLIPKSAILTHQSGPLYTTSMFCSVLGVS
jgi:hypothetical protein